MPRVTDPNLLAQLNGSEANRVNDPTLLEQLNSHSDKEKDQPNNAKQQSLLSSLAQIPYDLAVGGGGGIQNLGHGLLPSLIPSFKPHGLSQHLGELIGNITAFSGGGEVVGATSKAIPLVSKAIEKGSQFIPALIKRLGENTLYGAINQPEDRLKGASTGLITGAAGELLPAGINALGKGAEFLYPQKYTNELANSIKTSYQQSKRDASDRYRPVIDTVGKEKIATYPHYSEYRKLGRETFDDYPAKLKDSHQAFMKDPNLKNAHELQSQIAKTLSKYVSKNESQRSIEKLAKAKDYLQNDIHRFLQTNSPPLSKQYKEAAYFYKKNVVPYNDNKTIREIASGNVKTLKPQELQESLRKVSEKEGLLPEKHTLREALKQLSHRISRGKTFSHIGSLAAGAAVPGVGLLGGALGGHYLTPKLLALATNPYVTKTISKLQSPYDALVKSIIHSQTAR